MAKSKIKNQKSKLLSQSSVLNSHNSIDIDRVAKLANLTLTGQEKIEFEKQLGEVLGYVSSLNELNTDKVEPIGHITGLENVSREDVAAPSLDQEQALANAKRTHNGFFEVEAIFTENDQ